MTSPYWPTPPQLTWAQTYSFAVRIDMSLMTDEHVSQLTVELPQALEHAVLSRRAEYTIGRFCAARALRQASSSETHVLFRGDRSPGWPAGYVGSITHAAGYVQAIVAPESRFRGIGIDCEQLISADRADQIHHMVLLGDERTILSALGTELGLTLIFSAKESIYKCLRPLVGRFFEFKDAEVKLLDPSTHSFEFVLKQDLNEEFRAGYTGCGIFKVVADKVFTGLALPIGVTGPPPCLRYSMV